MFTKRKVRHGKTNLSVAKVKGEGEQKSVRLPRRQMTAALAKSNAIVGRPDAPPFDGVAFLRSLR